MQLPQASLLGHFSFPPPRSPTKQPCDYEVFPLEDKNTHHIPRTKARQHLQPEAWRPCPIHLYFLTFPLTHGLPFFCSVTIKISWNFFLHWNMEFGVTKPVFPKPWSLIFGFRIKSLLQITTFAMRTRLEGANWTTVYGHMKQNTAQNSICIFPNLTNNLWNLQYFT